MHIDHINIAGPPALLEQVRDFYCGILGLEEGFRPRFQRGGTWLYTADRAIVHLSENPGLEGSGQSGHLDHVAFQTSGLEAMGGRLKANGVEYRVNYIPELNMTQLFLKDPAGTGIEINFPGETPEGLA